MKDLFESERLTYRAVDIEKDEDFFRAIRDDSILSQLSHAGLHRPQKPSDANDAMKSAIEDCYLSVVICISPSPKGTNGIGNEKDDGTTPIGLLKMRGGDGRNAIHHRQLEFGLKILQEHQNKGYGAEIISWGLSWAFNVAGMHRVQLGCFEFNTRAVHLYQKLGFRLEGRARERFWHDGRFWDDIHFGILDREWRALVKEREEKEPTHQK